MSHPNPQGNAGKDRNGKPSAGPQSGDSPGKNLLEWAVFAVSCVLVLGTLGVLINEMRLWKNAPAELTAATGTPRTVSGRVLVPVEVRNSGDALAVGVEVEVKALGMDREEVARLVIERVPRKAVRHGEVSFSAGEGTWTRFEAQVMGFELP